jgi:ABC-2 type transport system permease protein
MSAILNHFTFDFKTGLRNPSAMLINYLFPLAFYGMMGGVMTKINPGYTNMLLPSMVIFALMVPTILGLPGPLVEAREAGIFRSFKINGVPVLSILSIPAISTIFHALIVAIIISITAVPVFGGLAPASWQNLALIAILTALVFGSIGALIGVVAKNSRSIVLYSQLIFLPSILLGGLMIPIDMLPQSVQTFSGLLPTTYAMQALMAYAYQQKTVYDPQTCVIVLVVGGLLAMGLAIYLFNWDSHNQARRGTPLLALIALLPYIAGIFLAH